MTTRDSYPPTILRILRFHVEKWLSVQGSISEHLFSYGVLRFILTLFLFVIVVFFWDDPEIWELWSQILNPTCFNLISLMDANISNLLTSDWWWLFFLEWNESSKTFSVSFSLLDIHILPCQFLLIQYISFPTTVLSSLDWFYGYIYVSEIAQKIFTYVSTYIRSILWNSEAWREGNQKIFRQGRNYRLVSVVPCVHLHHILVHNCRVVSYF